VKNFIHSFFIIIKKFSLFLSRKILLPLSRKVISVFGIFFKKIKPAIQSFSYIEKTLFAALIIIFILSSSLSLLRLNTLLTVTVPAEGGSLQEGVVGAARFINPLLAISDADRDLTALIYGGLLRATAKGEIIPDLAKEYLVSEDGLSYTFILKDNLLWHDGEPITSDDIVFTIKKVQDSALKSTKRASWEGVSVKKIDDKTIIFTLKQKYSPFLENTTLGILPRHIWENISSEQFGFSKFNVEPIGSGPYRVGSIKHNSSGIPEYYDLVSFQYFSLGRPFIPTLKIRFYSNEERLLKAFEKGEIGAINAISSQKITSLNIKDSRITTYVLPRVFGVFFNQSQNTIFTSLSVRSALQKAVNREAIIEDVLLGYGTPIRGPLPPGSLGFIPKEEEVTEDDEDGVDEDSSTITEEEDATKTSEEGVAREEAESNLETEKISSSLKEARAILARGGWVMNEETGIFEKKTKKTTTILKFSIATSDAQELKSTALSIKKTWEDLGAVVDLKIFTSSDLNHNVIRPRKYDALFFGEIIGRESDPFAFWHSSQRNDPGLNIALYANITADKLLEEGRVVFDKEERIKIYQKFEEEVRGDIPAIFIYSPDFIYVVPKKIKGIDVGTITVPSERFLDIYTWYIETEQLWKIFN